MIYFVQETGLFRNRVKIGFIDNIKEATGNGSGPWASPAPPLPVLPIYGAGMPTQEDGLLKKWRCWTSLIWLRR